MTTPLFSTYSQGENRVTATFLAVLERLSLPNIDRILGALTEDTSFSLVTFENQPSGKTTIPDARIRTGSSIWIETKTARNSVNRNQLKGHLQNVANDELLLLLTPDDDRPNDIPDRVVWANFRTLSESIEEILTDEEVSPSAQEDFLLREFIYMLRQDGILDTVGKSVMVIGARVAWPMYEKLGVYRCSVSKPMRSLDSFDHIAFYTNKAIQPRVAKIKTVIQPIDITRQDEIDALACPEQRRLSNDMKAKVESMDYTHEFGRPFKIMFLSEFDDEEGGTVKLCKAIANDKKDKNGRPVPFTYGQPRYVTLESLKNARHTSELELC